MRPAARLAPLVLGALVVAAARSGPVAGEGASAFPEACSGFRETNEVRLRACFGSYRLAHAAAVTAVAFVGSQKAVSASRDRTLREWDLGTGDELALFLSPEVEVTACAVTSDGKTIAAATEKGDTFCDSVEALEQPGRKRYRATMRPLGTHPEHSCSAVGLSLEGNLLLEGEAGPRGVAHVWRPGTRDALATLSLEDEPGGRIRAVAMTPDRKRLVAAGYSIRVWDLETKTPVWSEINENRSEVAGLASDGSRAVTGGDRENKERPKVWDLVAGKLLRELDARADFTAVAVFAGGARALTASVGRLELWDLASGQLERTLTGSLGLERPEGLVEALAVSSDGARALSGGADGRVRLWDLTSGAELLPREPSFTQLAVAPAGSLCVVARSDRRLEVLDLATGARVRSLPGELSAMADEHGLTTRALAVASVASTLVAVGGKVPRVLDTATGRLVCRCESGLPGGVSAIAVSPDGGLVLGGSPRTRVKLWSAVSGEELLEEEGGVQLGAALAFSPEGDLGYVGGEPRPCLLDARARVFAWGPEGRKVRARDVTFLPGRDHEVLVATEDGVVTRFRLGKTQEACSLMRTFVAHGRDVVSIAVSPDGKRLVTSGVDRRLWFWDVQTGERSGPLDLVSSMDWGAQIAFGERGRTLVVKTARGVILVFGMKS